MPVRICDHCEAYFIAGERPDPDTDVEHCRVCDRELRPASQVDLLALLRQLKVQRAAERLVP